MKPRVLHLITKLELGGAQRNTLYTVENLDPGKWEKFLLAGEGGMLDEEARSGKTFETRFLPHLVREIQPLADARALWDLFRAFRRIRPDVLHTHSSKAGILGRLAGRLAGVPVIVHSVHGFSFSPHHPRLVSLLFQAAERLVAPLTTHFICVSRDNLERGRELGLWNDRRVSLIRSGIDLEKYSGRGVDRREVLSELGLPEAARVVGSVGNFKAQKAPMDLLEVFARVAGRDPVAHLVVAGDGPLRPQAEAWVREQGLEHRVHLLGWRRDVPELLQAFDVFLLMSLWEGLPRSILQARAAGRAIVATAVDGTAEALEDGISGFLVAAGDREAAADRVLGLLSDAALRERMGCAARVGLEEFGIDLMVKQQDELYTRLLGRIGPASATTGGVP